MKNKHIAILGGSFNPITLSHVQIAILTYESNLFDEVWISPCYSNPLKDNLINPTHRLKMCELAIQGIDEKIIISDFEIENKITQGTYYYLKKLSEEYPDYKFSYIIGGDQVNILNKWINYEKLIEEFDFVVFNRGNEEMNLDKSNFNYTLINERIEPLSSTLFREHFKKQNFETCKYIVDYKVFAYILKQNLYNNLA